jgi:hypothetical protein
MYFYEILTGGVSLLFMTCPIVPKTVMNVNKVEVEVEVV